jgi:FkbM family methyltransferase
MYSQLGQDLWILESTNYKTYGYFIDIGAYDGIFHSNTYLLEKEYGWKGICVEPSTKYNDLCANRFCCKSNMALYEKSNMQVDFYETVDNMELSGIPSLFKQDGHESSRLSHILYRKDTIALTDLCEQYKTPNIIDYLSIDTEGSELTILKTHNFAKYRFNYITIEHNRNQEYKQEIEYFLNINGYELDKSDRFLKISQNQETSFDDWYIYRGKK